MVGIPVTIASRFVTIINVIPIKTIGMISQISVYPKLLPSIAAVVIAPGPITIPVAINPGPILFIRSFNGSRSTFAPNTSVVLFSIKPLLSLIPLYLHCSISTFGS